MARSELEKLCEEKGVTIESTYGVERIPEGMERMHAYTCKLRYKRRSLTVPFFQGEAHTNDPRAADVLYCLLSDVTSVENANSFEEWCGDLGFDTDSRKAEKIFKECERMAPKLRRFLGEDFETFVQSEH